MKDLAVFGLGRMGESLALNYSQGGGKVIVVDKNQEKIDEISDMVTYAVRADVMDEKVLMDIGIGNVDVAVISVGDNFEASIIITTVCKELGVPQIIAKARTKLQGNVLKKVGADEIIYPESDIGRRLAKNLLNGGNFLDIADISDEFSIVEVDVPHEWVGRTLTDLNTRQKYGINVVAVQMDGQFMVNLDANIPFKEGMELVILGENRKLAKVFNK